MRLVHFIVNILQESTFSAEVCRCWEETVMGHEDCQAVVVIVVVAVVVVIVVRVVVVVVVVAVAVAVVVVVIVVVIIDYSLFSKRLTEWSVINKWKKCFLN